jgi:endo-alpha-1,4-polygalactosaminidase (GH114 family)
MYSSYVLQYANVDVAQTIARGTDLLITEGDPLRAGHPNAAVTDAEVAQLTAVGVDVVGYVDTSVTDDTRPYWNPAWTSDGTDTGTPTGAAPSWLQGSTLYSFDPANDFPNVTYEARIVNVTDASWIALVLDQVRDLKLRGYSGVFLDDIGTYFPAGPSGATAVDRAIAMVDLVLAIRADLGPALKIITNGSPYVGSDAGMAAAFAGAIDAMVLESYFRTTAQPSLGIYIDAALTNVGGSAQLLGLEYAAATGDTVTREGLFDYGLYLEQRGITSFFSGATISGAGTSTYNNGGVPSGAATAGNDVLFGTGVINTLNGGNGNDRIAGLAGDDALFGGNGADVISGGLGNDIVNAGAQDDTIYGGDGNDSLRGSLGNDALTGGAGKDVLLGGDGADHFVFTKLSDSTNAAAGRDTLLDFIAAQADRIDLSAIDANALLAGNQTFVLDAGGAFTTGEIRQVVTAAGVVLQMKVDADSVIDMAIFVRGVGVLAAGDFVL